MKPAIDVRGIAPTGKLRHDTFPTVRAAAEALELWLGELRAEGHDADKLAATVRVQPTGRVSVLLATRPHLRSARPHKNIIKALAMKDAADELRVLFQSRRGYEATVLLISLLKLEKVCNEHGR
jgi:hypothetical protein